MPWFKDASGRPVWQDGGGVTLPAPAKARYEGPQAAATLGKTREEIEAIRQQTAIDARKQTLAEREFQIRQQQAGARQRAAREAKKTRVMGLMNDIVSARKIKRDAGDGIIPGLGEVGAVGGMFAGIPGTAARDINGRLTALKSSIARSSLGQMRQESPTGAAAGNTSDRDITMFETARGPIDQGAKYSDFARNLDDVEARTWEELKKLSPAGARILRERLDGKKAKPAAPRGAPSRGEFLGFED